MFVFENQSELEEWMVTIFIFSEAENECQAESDLKLDVYIQEMGILDFPLLGLIKDSKTNPKLDDLVFVSKKEIVAAFV